MTVGAFNSQGMYSNVNNAGGYMTPAMAGVTQTGVSNAGASGETKAVLNPGESTQVQPGKKSSPAECETCRNRKYQDGSDEMVSFKSAQHVSPTS